MKSMTTCASSGPLSPLQEMTAAHDGGVGLPGGTRHELEKRLFAAFRDRVLIAERTEKWLGELLEDSPRGHIGGY